MAYFQDDKENGSFLSPNKAIRLKARLKRTPSTTSLDLNMLSEQKKRNKRKREEDVVSVQSFDPQNANLGGATPRKRHSLDRVTSFVNLFSPVAEKIAKTFERSRTCKTPSAADGQSTPSSCPRSKRAVPKSAPLTPCRLWCETVDAEIRSSLSAEDCKRQESIHELITGEESLIADLELVDGVYRKLMEKLNILSGGEVDQIFGIVERLVPCHRNLVLQLKALRQPNNVIGSIGQVLLDWIPSLKQYETYCANQVFAKVLLDCKKNDPRVEDFLQRCQQSGFSRKLDLWSFLDLPRSRLVKYPLLLQQILKYTLAGTEESQLLRQSICKIEDIIKVVDSKMGESKCRQTVETLDYLDTLANADLFKSARLLLCSGELKNDRGTKLDVFLFDSVVALTYARRSSARDGRVRYQVCRDLIPVAQLRFDEACFLELEQSSNFSSQGSTSKKGYVKRSTTDRLSFPLTYGKDSQSLTTVTLTARDEHDRKQWLACLKKAISSIDSIEQITDRAKESVHDESVLQNTESVASRQSSHKNNAVVLFLDCDTEHPKETLL